MTKESRYKLENFKYKLDTNIYLLTDRDIDLLHAANMLQEYHMSLRTCAKDYGIAKSSLHDFISNGKLRRLSFELYQLCKNQLLWNKSHIKYFMKKK